MSIKNSFLGGSDWGAEDWYYQDVNDTINTVAYSSVGGNVSRGDILSMPIASNVITLGAGAEDSTTNMTSSYILSTTTTGSYSVVFPELMLPKSYQTFLITADAIIGRKITDATSTGTFVSDISIYKNISFGFFIGANLGTSGSRTSTLQITDGTNTATIDSVSGSTSSNTVEVYKTGSITLYFDSTYDTAIAHIRAYYGADGAPSSKDGHMAEEWKSLDLSSFSGTVYIEAASSGTAGSTNFETYGACGISDNEFDNEVTISISTDSGTTWDALGKNGIPVEATAAGSTIKAKLEGSAAAADEKLLLRSISIVPLA